MERLVVARQAAGLSLADTVEKLAKHGVTVSAQLIHYWEKGARLPSEEDLRLLGSILGMSEENIGAMVDVVEARRKDARLRRRSKSAPPSTPDQPEAA
jgi:transcriptional regulator with XRE-family HTH domain